MIVFDQPGIEIGLRVIDPFAERDPVELVEHGAMEAFDAVGLRALGFGTPVINVLNGEIELTFVALGAAKFGADRLASATIGCRARRRMAHPVIEDLGRGDRRLAVIELGKRDLGIGVDHGLLVDPAHAL